LLFMIKFFDRFRKKPETNEVKKDVVSFENLKKRIGELVLENDKDEERVLLRVRNEIEILKRELEEKMRVLSEINLEKKREDERLKRRVIEGKNDYIRYCQRFLKDILAISGTSEDYFAKINNIFYRFENEGKKAFEIATILIGEETHQVRRAINDFFKNQLKICDESKNVFLRRKVLREIKEKNNLILSLENKKSELANEIVLLEKDLVWKKSLLDKKNTEIDELRNSASYKEMILDKKRRAEKLMDLIRGASLFRDKINLKELMNIYHGNEKYRDIINRYRDNFVSAMVDDENVRFAEMLSGDKVDEFKKIRNEIVELKGEINYEIEKKELYLISEIKSVESESINDERYVPIFAT
jgi:hypothetical protein